MGETEYVYLLWSETHSLLSSPAVISHVSSVTSCADSYQLWENYLSHPVFLNQDNS